MENSNSAQAHFESTKLVLGKVAADLFGVDFDSLDWDKSFIMLGGDSILAIDFIVRCRDAGIMVDMKDLLTAGSLAILAKGIARQKAGAVNGVNGHANVVKVNGHANGMKVNGEATARNGSNGPTPSTAMVARQLRFAFLEIPEDTQTSVVLNALGCIVARHSALRSTWSVSSTGSWTLSTTASSATKGKQPFYSAESSDVKKATDAFELLGKDLLSDGAPSLGCLVLPNDAPRSSRAVVLGADANLVDVLSMRLLLRELRASIKGRELEPISDFQFSDWVVRGCHGLREQVEKANATKSKSTVDTSAPKTNGHAKDAVTFQLSHSTTEKLFASHTHAALRTSPVDIVNAALTHTLGPRYRDTEDVLTIKSAYSVREEQSIPLDSIGCYEVEAEWEAPAPESNESLVHLIRRVRDARAGFSAHAEAESTTSIYVDCTRLQNLDEDESSPRLSDSVPHHASYVSLATEAGQVHVSLQLASTSSDAKRIADKFKLCIEEMVDELIKAPEMMTLHNFPLVHWQYSALDDLAMDLHTHGLALGDVESIAPCSAVQESFFVSQSINPGSYISNATLRLLPNSADVPRRLETERVVNAWRDVVERHAMLRTAFVESNDRPGKFDQLVLKSTAMPPLVAVISSPADASNLPPFTTGKFQSPLRLNVYEISADELRLELEISHALVDGHSAKILLHDIRASYLRAAYFSEQPPLSYTIFASRQQATLSEGEASAGGAYWTSYLNKASESHLPLITTNPHLKNLETARCSVPMPEGKLRAFCGQFSITPANLFHVAWALAIRRIILSDTITFSYIVSGRNSDVDGVEATVGPFINTLPFCMALDSDTSVADALGLAKRDWQDGLPFQNIPIADLPVAKTRSLKRLGNTMLSIEREGSNSHPFTEETHMALDARTSASDVRVSSSWIICHANEISV